VTEPTKTGLEAWKAWRGISGVTRRAMMRRPPTNATDARIGFDYAAFALSGIGLLINIGGSLVIIVAVLSAMVALEFAPDTFDVVLLVGTWMFLAFNHLRVYTRLRDSAEAVLLQEE
jgi:hypothetical protein